MFINESVDKILRYHLNHYKVDQLPSEKERFNIQVLDILIRLYEEINIITPYTSNDKDLLFSALENRGATKELIEELFSLMDEAELNKGRINEILTELIILKDEFKMILPDELDYYEGYFSVYGTPPKFSDFYKSKTESVEEKKELFLPEERYEAHGVSIDEIKDLPEPTIERINNEIIKRDSDNGDLPGGRVDKPKSLVLTSGNGFVDALILFGIMCTELMIGVIVTVLIARFK